METSRVIGNMPGIRSLRGWYSEHDKRNNLILATATGDLHYMFWTGNNPEVKSQRLDLSFGADSIFTVSGHYTPVDRRHIIVLGTSNGKVHLIFGNSAQNGIELKGNGDLPGILFPEPIVAVSGLFNPVDHHHVIVVASKAQTIHQILLKSGTQALDGNQDLPVEFNGFVHSISTHYSADDFRLNLILGTTGAPRVDWLNWELTSQEVDETELPARFILFPVLVSSYYSFDNRREHALYINNVSRVSEIVFASEQDSTNIQGPREHGIEHGAGDVVAVSGHYDASEKNNHAITARTTGEIQLISWKHEAGDKDCTNFQVALKDARANLEALKEAIQAKKEELDEAIQNHDPQIPVLKEELKELRDMLPRAEEAVEDAKRNLAACEQT